MPDRKMDKKKLEQYKKLLITQKDQINGDIKKMTDSNGANGKDAGDVSAHAFHIADVATDMYDREFNLGLASNDRQVLLRIDDALKRIEEGEYGTCSDCKKPIIQARLKALPFVEKCVKCQEKEENGQH